MTTRIWASSLPLCALAAALAGCATTPPPARLDSFALGRNASGEGCIASRNWNDPGVPDSFARAYGITCSGAAANRPLGTLRAVTRSAEALAAVDAQFECGPEQAVTLANRPATARQCLDRVTGLESIRIDAERGDTRYVAAAAPALLSQIEEAIAIASGEQPAVSGSVRTPVATLNTANLAARPGAGTAALPETATPGMAGAASPLNIAGALALGTNLNHKGLHVEASRVLNDALSRLPADSPPATRAELLLEAALADSNIRFPEAAAAHFLAADRAFADAPAARTGLLLRKRDTYLALDALNRRAFPEALTILDGMSRLDIAVRQPLADQAAMRLLNQPRGGGSADALALPNIAQLTNLVLDAQMHYARSVALLAQDNLAGSKTAIEAASTAYRPLSNERLEQPQMLWLGARIFRQTGRIQARSGDYRAALESYDTAVDMLRRSSIANFGTGTEPAIADAELERASVYARTGASRSAIRNTFAEAVDALIVSGAASLGHSIGMEDYLDLLVVEAASRPQADTYDRFFRAVQASGEPAVARQLSQLRTVVEADPAVAAAVRERTDLEREVTRLRYAITGNAAEEGVKESNLEKSRDEAENRLLVVDAQLASNPRYRQVDESPTSLADLRKALLPGEAFIKITELDRRVYGMVVTADRTMIYHVANSPAAKQAVDQLGEQLRATIDGRLADGQIVPFDEARAYTLWRLVSGPAAELLAGSRAIVVDPAGPLERLPLGALVTRYDPNAVREDAFDFSRTAFLARSASISTALSPRSFLVARALPPSRASQPFLGFGEHVPPAATGGSAAQRKVEVGFGCSVDYGRLAMLARSLTPINRRELGIAASALGAASAPGMTGAGFSDTAVEARSDLDQFAVLHFATHGLEEGMWGCAKSPPALVTSFGDADSDGLLSFSEIARMRLDANLVVLSACDTASGIRDEALARASGQEEAGSSLEGLVRAFLTANARAVLATYWQVSAEAESDAFIQAFYARGRTGTIGEALQNAQRTLIDQPSYSHPFYWAPYFLVGDSSKTMLSPARPQVATR